MARKLKEPPDYIYLQFHGDGDPQDDIDLDAAEVTWCVDQIFDRDVLYKRVKHPRRAKKRARGVSE